MSNENVLTFNDLEYIYGIIERANITGKEAGQVIALKTKIITILKAAQSTPSVPTNDVTPEPTEPEPTA